jgi:hypothetical protein
MAKGKSSPLVALLAIIVAFGFMAFIASDPNLRDNPFYQGVTGVVLVAAVAVALFSAVPSSMTIRGGIAVIGGAAALFLYSLEPVKGFLFRTRTVTGTVYYANSTKPVQGVSIRNPMTRQEVTTDARGDFTLPQVSTDVKALTASLGGEDYTLTLNEEGKYPIIKPPTIALKTQHERIVGKWDVVANHQCPLPESVTKRDVNLYMLKKTLAVVKNYPNLYVQVSAPYGTEIIHAEKLEPSAEIGSEVAPGESEEAAKLRRKWWLPVGGQDQMSIELAVCLKQTPGGRRQPAALEAEYWFEKEVEQK